jgi:hypothetical protein
MRALLPVICAALASPVLAAPGAQTDSSKQAAEFAPRKAYRECLNRNFALRLTRKRTSSTPDTIAEEALLDCRGQEKALAAFAEELIPVVKDRMRAWLVSEGHIPPNLWWP